MTIAITPGLLIAATGCTRADAYRFAEHLDDACRFYGISESPQRLAAFLTQVGHESGGLRYVREIASGSAYDVGDLARRLGNTPEDDGDGERLKGRGLIQTTGADNYRRTTKWLREALQDPPDFFEDPAALEQPRWASWSAAAYWHHTGLNPLADVGRFIAIGRAINRGDANSTKQANGEADRLERWARAKAAIASAPAPAPDPAPTPAEPAPAPKEPAMPLPAFAAAALPALVQAVPDLIRMFGKNAEKAEKNAKAAELVLEVAKGAVGAPNEQALVEAIQTDDKAAGQVRQAVTENWHAITALAEVGGGIAAARSANIAQSAVPPSKNIALWVTIALLPLLYMTVGAVLFGEGWTNDVKAMVVASIVSGLLGAITGYWLGTSFSSMRKDEQRAAGQGAAP